MTRLKNLIKWLTYLPFTVAIPLFYFVAIDKNTFEAWVLFGLSVIGLIVMVIEDFRKFNNVSTFGVSD